MHHNRKIIGYNSVLSDFF